MIRNKTLQRSVLNRYSDTLASKIIGCSRERARQLRAELKIPITTQEANIQHSLRMKELSYIKCMNGHIVSTRNPLAWSHGKAFAKAHNLPWPPPRDPEETEGVRIYRYAEANPDLKWLEIDEVFGMKNCCSRAARAAGQYALAWPLRGGKR